MTWPIINKLNKKNGRAFNQAIQGIIHSRMALEKDAKHDFYSIAARDMNTKEGLMRSELWAEAIFFLPAGKFMLNSYIRCPSRRILRQVCWQTRLLRSYSGLEQTRNARRQRRVERGPISHKLLQS